MAFTFKYPLISGDSLAVTVETNKDGEPEVSVSVPLVPGHVYHLPAMMTSAASNILYEAECQWHEEQRKIQAERAENGIAGSEPEDAA